MAAGLSQNPVLVMDNASFHHTERFEQMYHDTGIILVYLLPYSPDINPIKNSSLN